MKVSRIYEAQSLDPNFYQSIDLFIFGTVTDEERNRRLASLWGGKKLPTGYHLDYDLETEEYTLITASLGSIPEQTAISVAKADITAHLRTQLDSIGVRGKNLLVDITGISQPAIFFLLKLLYEDVRPTHLFFAYTEPFRYRAKSLPSSEDVFELTERFIGLRALPGFVRRSIEGKKPVIVLLIGFEGKRAKYRGNIFEKKEGVYTGNILDYRVKSKMVHLKNNNLPFFCDGLDFNRYKKYNKELILVN